MHDAWVVKATAVLALAGSLVYAQGEGTISGPQTSPEAAGYNCDTSACKLPDCLCASTSPPGGLKPEEVPQFIVFTADDAIQSYTLDAVNQFLAHRKNPNGCAPKMTYFTSLEYTNYTLVTDWYVAGNEIADHTMTHVGDPPADEINGNLVALNALAGIPLSSIKGFRAPFLNYSAETFKLLHAANFLYDSSAAATIPVDDPNTDAYWPYTLDYGMANNCLTVPGTCKGELKLPGFWEIPMYALFDDLGINGPHLMDPWLDNANGQNHANDTATLLYMQHTFTAHYKSNRQPIGLYAHPIHLSKTYPGVNVPQSTIDMINAFLDWAQEQDNVWLVSNEQLLDWVRNPVPLSQLNNVASFKCSVPNIGRQICNGVPQNEDGLLAHCASETAPFYTCYGCPQSLPTPNDPNPPQLIVAGSSPRFRLPANCSTAFWDPIKGECLCQSSSCSFLDTSRPIGPNGANLTGGGVGGAFASSANSPQETYVQFNAGVRAQSSSWVFIALVSLSASFGLQSFEYL
ncbi:hypothetical protein BDN72DRAFT_158724 [Pluteus cervinus]|uniref:Uncharacterized protein n=1 Tax=Pluteus cervinus TaxID=181527 RepID=A0ACD3AKW5_9AGAR|nr:hypothetical protein BDN72DRAFT_158724 [Pluteus cervinus]